ncbi:MAG: sigma-70 family RNA polymerase sigma factor [Bacteroides sp.]|nr:sigma-70 family RNA polymerase sigma factor [Bacteroides sp.]MBD5308638.1 sigma-70 family RNA polymerase sigma factor [Bacteroides sp.]MDE7471088.1 sigma-70 family RNA polymerase sigma factor [Paramuribaculum sp.]
METNNFTQRLTRLMEKHKQRLFRYACYRTGSITEAEDVLQDVYLKTLEKRSESEGIRNLEAYIVRSVINECASRCRMPEMIGLDEMAPSIAHCEPADFQEEYQLINSLLRELPPDAREIVRLRIYASMTFDDIAAVMMLSKSTAKRRYYAALDTLRSKYHNNNDQP